MAAVIAYTLPTIQLVCHLITPGTSDTNSMISVPAATQLLPPQYQTTPLPDGYVAKPDLGFAYKYHPTKLNSWIKAQNVCIQEGARLAVIDSLKKMEYLVGQLESRIVLVHTGVIRMDDAWINSNTGEPVAETVPWRPEQPSGNLNCAFLDLRFDERGLNEYYCNTARAVFFCEIPILANSTINVN